MKECYGAALSPILMAKMFEYSVDFHQFVCLDLLNLDLLQRPVVATNTNVLTDNTYMSCVYHFHNVSLGSKRRRKK